MTARFEPVLIGPSGAGKSTLAPLLGEALGLAVCKVDRLRWEYYERWGLTRAESDRVSAEQGWAATLELWRPYEIRLTETLLDERLDCVFDFGAGFAHHDDPERAARFRAALHPFRNVILVLPSEDVEEAVRVLWDRSRQKYDPAIHGEFFDFPRYEVMHSLPREVATIVLYEEGRTPEECAAEVVGRLAQT